MVYQCYFVSKHGNLKNMERQVEFKCYRFKKHRLLPLNRQQQDQHTLTHVLYLIDHHTKCQIFYRYMLALLLLLLFHRQNNHFRYWKSIKSHRHLSREYLVMAESFWGHIGLASMIRCYQILFLKCNADNMDMKSSTNWNEITVNVEQPSFLFLVYFAANGIKNICKHVFLTFHLSIRFSVEVVKWVR